jgi:hypothetical protein
MLGAGTKSLSECFRTAEIFDLETIGTIGTAETFGTGSSRGTAGTIETGFS